MIDILMATHNGEEFIKEQLDSIILQSYTDWRLIISDDCSRDDTASIIKKYQEKYPDKILLFKNDVPSGSAQNNFFNAIKYTTSDYVMFSDQDDVWLPDKIENTYNKMIEMEKEYGKNTPVLIHTDLKVVDRNLKTINDSLFKMMNMDSNRCAFNNLLVQNIVTGCTVMGNRALFNYLEKIPKNAVMHDMWIALIASAFGEIGFVDKSTMLYRQHGNNSVGAKDTKSLNYVLEKISNIQKVRNSLAKQYKQAEEFREIYKDVLSKLQLDILESYSSFGEKSYIEKYRELKRYKLHKKNKLQVLGQIFV